MKNTLSLTLSATLLAASSASAAIGSYSDDFESYTLPADSTLTDSANWSLIGGTAAEVLGPNATIQGAGSGQMADFVGGFHGVYHPGISLGEGESFTAETLVSWTGGTILGGLTIGANNVSNNYHAVLLGGSAVNIRDGGSFGDNFTFTTAAAANTWYRLTVSGTQGGSTISVSVFDTVAEEYKMENESMAYGVGGDTIASGIQFGFMSYAADSHKYDDFSITIVPEPSSFALLSGLLALSWVMVRRRN